MLHPELAFEASKPYQLSMQGMPHSHDLRLITSLQE
jgi:hypothetical protein